MVFVAFTVLGEIKSTWGVESLNIFLLHSDVNSHWTFPCQSTILNLNSHVRYGGKLMDRRTHMW